MSSNETQLTVSRLILIPAIISLVVTLLRLAGEMAGGSSLLFNAEAGGPLVLVGIVWLVPIFGIYFALKLSQQGYPPAGLGRLVGVTLLSLVVMIVLVVGITAALGPGVLSTSLASLACVVPIWLMCKPWPAFWKVMFAYGLAARIPVVVVMLLAIQGNWGTHYDAPPPDFPEGVAWFTKWVSIGLLPQLFIWIAFTLIVGALFGALALAISRTARASEPAEASAPPWS